jgi:hypothetical protein
MNGEDPSTSFSQNQATNKGPESHPEILVVWLKFNTEIDRMRYSARALKKRIKGLLSERIYISVFDVALRSQII